jgi:hypothetical protein
MFMANTAKRERLTIDLTPEEHRKNQVLCSMPWQNPEAICCGKYSHQDGSGCRARRSESGDDKAYSIDDGCVG